MAHAISARMSAVTILSLLLLPALLVLPITGSWLGFAPETWLEALVELGQATLPIAATFIVLPFFFLRYGLWFGALFRGSARALAVAVVVALVWLFGAEYIGAKAYYHYENRVYINRSGEYNFSFRAEDVRRINWIRLARGIASPAGLPEKILQEEDAVHPAATGMFTVFYFSLGMLLHHRTLRRVRKRYG